MEDFQNTGTKTKKSINSYFMTWGILFFVNSCLLGVALAVDAFSVSVANAICEPNMKRSRMCGIAAVYAVFQFAMPLLGWLCVHTIVNIFTGLQKFVPFVALFLLAFIGIKMIISSCSKSSEPELQKTSTVLTLSVLLLQGVATSIDALSVGFAISEYGFYMALVASALIAAVTFAICLAGLFMGRHIGKKVGSRAELVGGLILIFIGLEIFIRGVFF